MRSGVLHLIAGAAVATALASPASAQKKYDTGASDTEIKIGQTVPFSGAYSVYANIGKTQAAYFKMINDQGGINGQIGRASCREKVEMLVGAVADKIKEIRSASIVTS